MLFSFALIAAIVGAVIVFISKDSEMKDRVIAFVALSVVYTLLGWWFLYAAMPSTAYPLWGGYSGLILVW